MISNDLAQGMLENSIPLMFGHPDPETLLTPELRDAMLHVINSPHANTTLQYGAGQGPQSLINFLVEKIHKEQGLSLQPGNILLSLRDSEYQI